MMSFNDYVNHIKEKYCLATAIAVIQSKPDNLTIEGYIASLKNNINHDTMDSDIDVSICSDDFKYDSVNHITCNLVTDNMASDVVNPVTAATHDQVNHENNNINDIEKTTINFEYDRIKHDALQLVTNNVISDVAFHNDAQTAMTNDQVNHENDIDISDTQRTNGSISILNNFDSDVFRIQLVDAQSATTECFDILEELQRVEKSEKVNNIATGHNLSQITYYEESQDNTISAKTKTNLNVENKDIFVDRSTYINTNELEETQLYTVPEFTQNCTHYSQSQFDNVIIDGKYITNKKSNNRETNDDNIFIEFSQNAQDLDLYFNEIYNGSNTNYNSQGNCNKHSQNNTVTDVIDKNQNLDKIDGVNHKTNLNNEENQCNNTISNEVGNQDVISNIEDQNSSNEVIEMTEETVPFKLVEELNKVKMFLKRRGDKRLDGNSLDSGYRSDSQGRKLHMSASQMPVTWLNQSAHSMFTYLKTCPLISATRAVTKEISQILGTLVDKLHEDEIYPSFLEELLETVDVSLRQICEGDSSNDNALLIKDDQIQRILLINKSKHIQKYTINNITKYIEKIFDDIQNEETYEIKNINELENLSYVLYILELILMKYTKGTSQPTPQTSQDDEKLKKSSLSDIWRRKWNPSCDEAPPKKAIKNCSLEECSQVLNKLVVSCMESYSLISYSALKCFNLLQSV